MFGRWEVAESRGFGGIRRFRGMDGAVRLGLLPKVLKTYHDSSSLGRTSPPRLSTILQKLRLSPMHNRRQPLLPGMEGGDRLVREIKTWTGKGDDARDIQRRPRRGARLCAVTDLLKGRSATTAPRSTS